MALLGDRVITDIPTRKHQNRWMALQRTSELFGPLNAQVYAVALDG